MKVKSILKGWKKVIGFMVLGIFMAGIVAGCGLSKTADSGSADGSGNKEKIKIKVAYDQSSKPITYKDENGNATGYDVEVMKLVNQLLPQYEFEFIGTTSDDLLLGLAQGKYQVGVKNVFWTEERTKKFLYPKEFQGLSSTGLVLKKEHANIKSLADFAAAGLTLAPIAANNAQYTIIDEYNKANPNNQVKLQAGDSFTVDVEQWVNEGRVDGGVELEGRFKNLVLSESGPYHNLANDLVYNEFTVIKTWALFNKNEQKFADDYDTAIKQLKADKKLNELSKKFYGRDLFEVLDTANR